MQLNFQFRGLSIDFSGFTPYCALLVREQVLEPRASGNIQNTIIIMLERLKVRTRNKPANQRSRPAYPPRAQQIEDCSSNLCQLSLKRYAFLDKLDLFEIHVQF